MADPIRHANDRLRELLEGAEELRHILKRLDAGELADVMEAAGHARELEAAYREAAGVARELAQGLERVAWGRADHGQLHVLPGGEGA